jgi:hypothetical protein
MSTDNSWSVLRRINLTEVNKLVVIVVNAGTNPVTRRDKTPNVPGFFDTLTAAVDVPMGNYSFDTLEILRKIADEFAEPGELISACKKRAAAKGPQRELDIPEPHKIEVFPIEVAFEYIEASEERNWFKNLPTTLELLRETVDRLRTVGRQILREDLEFKKLLKVLHGCSASPAQNC